MTSTTPDGFRFLRPLDINDHGVIVGEAVELSGNVRPFRYDNESGFQLLDLLNPHLGGSARSINNSGVVVGNENSGGGDHRMTIWNPNGSIAHDSFGVVARGRSINDEGVALGFDPTNNRPFTWTAASGASYLSAGAFFNDADAFMIKDGGSVLGWAGDSTHQAAFWAPEGGPQILPDGQGTRPGTALDINVHGQIVGTLGRSNDWRTVATYWDSSTSSPTTLGYLTGDASALITDDGLVAGTTGLSAEGGNSSAFLWSADIGLLSLLDIAMPSNALVWEHLYTLTAINTNKQAVGFGHVMLPDGSFEDRGYVATIPPSSSVCLLMLAGGIAGIRRRRCSMAHTSNA